MLSKLHPRFIGAIVPGVILHRMTACGGFEFAMEK